MVSRDSSARIDALQNDTAEQFPYVGDYNRGKSEAKENLPENIFREVFV